LFISWMPPPYGLVNELVFTYGMTDAIVVPEKPAEVHVIASQPPPMTTVLHQLQRAISAADEPIWPPQTQTWFVRVAALEPVKWRAMPR
jgi:hypothetical protein